MKEIINIHNVGTVNFRPMRLEDVPQVYEVEERSYDFPWTEKLIQDCIIAGYFCWVVEFNQKIIGYAIYRIAVEEAHLFNIAIDPNYQNKGICRAFLGYLLEQMKTNTAQKVLLEVRVSNLAARKLYEHYGFKTVGTRKDYYPDKNNTREDALNLELLF